MATMLKLLDEVRAKIAADDDVLAEARRRRDAVAAAAMMSEGALRRFRSGSLAHGTVNAPVSDADGGVVLDRRTWTKLGPDGEGEGPAGIVSDICDLVDATLRDSYPSIVVDTSKRGLLVSFNDPVKKQDPTVDVIVTLTRKDADGLWIPNLHQNDWDASHPEKHTELFTAGARSLRALRARVIRLVKAETKQRPEGDRSLSSFNITALAWECILDSEMALDQALLQWYCYAAAELAQGDTKDPAGVSDPIKLLLPREIVVARLNATAGLLAEAMRADAAGDDDELQRLMRRVFPVYLEAPNEKAARAAIARTRQMAPTIAGIHLDTPPKLGRAYGADRG